MPPRERGRPRLPGRGTPGGGSAGVPRPDPAGEPTRSEPDPGRTGASRGGTLRGDDEQPPRRGRPAARDALPPWRAALRDRARGRAAGPPEDQAPGPVRRGPGGRKRGTPPWLDDPDLPPWLDDSAPGREPGREARRGLRRGVGRDPRDDSRHESGHESGHESVREPVRQPRREPRWEFRREPARAARQDVRWEPRRVPRGAKAGPRAGGARHASPVPRHGTGAARRVSTGPRKLVRRQGGNHHLRVVTVRFVLIAALVAAGLKLVQVQGFESEALAAKAAKQRTTRIEIPATRGSILDRNGVELAFSVETRMLAYRPRAMRKDFDKHNKEFPADTISFDDRTAEIARTLRRLVGEEVNEADLVAKMRRDVPFVFLIDVEPGVAREIQDQFPEVNADYRATREYPGGTLASNIVGVANWRMDDPDPKKHNLHGLSGLEGSLDNDLAGTPGRQTVDTEEGSQSVVIPGTERDLQPATDGSDVELTIDADVQHNLQQSLADYVVKAQARGGSAVVLDARTGEVYAMANHKSFDPNARRLDTDAMGNPAVSDPYEPGSVNKIVTALCAVEQDIARPGDVHQVDGSRRVADRTIRDAWSHDILPFTTTGIFAKSSNVGTLMLAEECGPDEFSRLLERLGLGQRTGVGLPGESPGRVPPRGQWSGSTFGNLPIGQGLSMTVLQMAAMYQAVANDGVRVPPRVIRAKISPDGTREADPKPTGVRVVSPSTAQTVRDMFRAVVQDGDGLNDGTGPQAALTGYQISGKTGTAQQFDRERGTYSDSQYWITFAGILPADQPRFVVGIVLDRPNYSGGEIEGRSAAPLFHDVASYLAQRYNIPLSKKPSPIVPLIAR